MLSCGLRFAVKCLYELCPRFSMPDETVETRPPWLDFSLPRHFCALKHNSTDTKQLRYSPARQHCLPHHRLTPLTLSYNVPVLTWVRTARRSQPALLPTRHNKFAGEYVVCSEENYELPRGSIFPINTKSPSISTIYPHMGSGLTS